MGSAGVWGVCLTLVLVGLGAGRAASRNISEALPYSRCYLLVFSIRGGNLRGLTRGAEKVSGTQMTSLLQEPGTSKCITVTRGMVPVQTGGNAASLRILSRFAVLCPYVLCVRK